jgi:hypothetical protein
MYMFSIKFVTTRIAKTQANNLCYAFSIYSLNPLAKLLRPRIITRCRKIISRLTTQKNHQHITYTAASCSHYFFYFTNQRNISMLHTHTNPHWHWQTTSLAHLKTAFLYLLYRRKNDVIQPNSTIRPISQ